MLQKHPHPTQKGVPSPHPGAPLSPLHGHPSTPKPLFGSASLLGEAQPGHAGALPPPHFQPLGALVHLEVCPPHRGTNADAMPATAIGSCEAVRERVPTDALLPGCHGGEKAGSAGYTGPPSPRYLGPGSARWGAKARAGSEEFERRHSRAAWTRTRRVAASAEGLSVRCTGNDNASPPCREEGGGRAGGGLEARPRAL